MRVSATADATADCKLAQREARTTMLKKVPQREARTQTHTHTHALSHTHALTHTHTDTRTHARAREQTKLIATVVVGGMFFYRAAPSTQGVLWW